MEPVEALALVSGRADEDLLLRIEYLAAENEILKSKLNCQIEIGTDFFFAGFPLTPHF
jgi:hypothetical protein